MSLHFTRARTCSELVIKPLPRKACRTYLSITKMYGYLFFKDIFQMKSPIAQLTRCFPLLTYMLFSTFSLHPVSYVLFSIKFASGLDLNAACTPVRRYVDTTALPLKPLQLLHCSWPASINASTLLLCSPLPVLSTSDCLVCRPI